MIARARLFRCRRSLRWLALFLCVFALALSFRTTSAVPLDTEADRALGQPNLQSNTSNNGGVSSTSLFAPWDLTIDPTSGRLYVADRANHRVLSWSSALRIGDPQAADLVIGQPDFTSNAANQGGVSAESLNGPSGVAVDSQGNLFVADSFNNRILMYSDPSTTDAVADVVFGQSFFTTSVANNGGVSASSLNLPSGLGVDAQDNLYAVDNLNSRALIYLSPLTTDTVADVVFGQLGSFVTGSFNRGGLSADSLFFPSGIAVDTIGNVYIADQNNHRVLQYETPLTSTTTADRVIGQPNFITNTINYGGLSAASLNTPLGVTVDSQLDVYVADSGNHRVLKYVNPLLTDTTAEAVFGQPDFVSGVMNNGGVHRASLAQPIGLAVDAHDNLLVSDRLNHRVLIYDETRFLSIPLLLR